MYREELMDIYKNPTHKGTIAAPSAQVRKKNPMCGDEVTMQLKIENGKITDAKFDGFACFVSIVSSLKETKTPKNSNTSILFNH